MPTVPPPFFPSIQNFLSRAAKAITGGDRGPSLLDMMSQATKDRLTPEFQKILATIPASQSNTTQGSQANFTHTGLPSWINPGTIKISSMVQPGRPSTQPMEDLSLLHEGIHAYDFNTGGSLEKAMTGMSPETRAEILRRMKWGLGIGNKYGETHITNPIEAAAYSGMYGYENVPPELKTVFSKIFKPVAGPPAPNPSGEARKNFDKAVNKVYTPAPKAQMK